MIDSKLPDVGTTIFTVMSALANEHGAINLSQGFPDFPIDPLLKDFVKEALDKEQVQYAPMAGRPDLRHAIAEKLQIQHGIQVNANTEITVTAGATQAIYCAIAAVVRTGDEVLLFDPAYDSYDPGIRMHGGIPIHLKLEHPTYRINWADARARITEKTRLIITNNPHNPSGSVWTEEDTAQLKELLKDHPNLLHISDEVYEHIQYDGVHQSVLKDDFLRSRSFAVYSFGKTFHVTGWKIGYVVAPEGFTTELRKNFQFLIIGL